MSHDNDNMPNIVHLDCIHTIRAYFCNSLFDSACVQKLHTLLLNLKGAMKGCWDHELSFKSITCTQTLEDLVLHGIPMYYRANHLIFC